MPLFAGGDTLGARTAVGKFDVAVRISTWADPLILGA